ncbi:MAG: pectate lyase [Verrucomicrobia bacterium]|jgi:PelA/Pel-15E family pectate lyase|nr:pectate lyase [Verrucomicrobiota bacterium]
MLSSQAMARLFILGIFLFYLTIRSVVADPEDYLKKPDAWFVGEEAKQVAANILSFQSDLGGWPKNVSTTEHHYQGERKDLKPTYDNGATMGELRFLARIFKVTKDPLFKTAFDRGLGYVLEGQYANGGWPQFHPPGKGYPRHITFNDNAMVRILEFLREVATEDIYMFVDEKRRRQASNAFDKGILCILKCQIKAGEKLTAWCAQHDEIDYRPQSARSYELATLSGSESVGITRLLMSLDEPSIEIVLAIESAIHWFEKARLPGIRLVTIEDDQAPQGRDRVVKKDEAGVSLWARFYTIETNQPIFVDRDGIPKPNLADIGYERRNGYAWYGTWPQRLLEIEYPKWKKRVAGR